MDGASSSPAVKVAAGALLQIGDEVFPPQKAVEGRQRVVGLLLAEQGVAPDRIEALTDAILATVNLNGPHLCSCLHVDGGSDPAHGHGFYQCGECGGLCVSERWCEHEIFGALWIEQVMQQNRHGHVVLKGLSWALGRLKMAVEKIAQTIPPGRQKLAILQAIDASGAMLSDYWHQNSLGFDLYDARGETEKLYERTPENLQRVLRAVKSNTPIEAMVAEFQFQPLSPAMAMERKALRASGEPQKAVDAHLEEMDAWATAWLADRARSKEESHAEIAVPRHPERAVPAAVGGGAPERQ